MWRWCDTPTVGPVCEGSLALLRIRLFMQSFQEPCDFQSSAVEVFYLRPHHTSLIRQGERERRSEAERERKRASAAVSTHSSVDRHQFTSLLWTHAVSHRLRQTDRYTGWRKTPAEDRLWRRSKVSQGLKWHGSGLWQ